MLKPCLPIRLITSILLAAVFFTSFAKPALAITVGDYVKNVYVPAVYSDPNINLQKHIKETVLIIPIAAIDNFVSLFYGGGMGILSCLPGDFQNALTGNNWLTQWTNCAKNVTTASNAGVLPVATRNTYADIANISSPLFAPPASGIGYIVNVAQEFHIIPKAQAQGYGFRALQGNESTILKIWRSTRNITYLFSAFGLVIMGFMIMFRVKISPQAVIAIEQTIPKFAITLLLITFSFAIAGFVIDLTYVTLFIFGNLFNDMQIPLSQDIVTSITNFFTGVIGLPAARFPFDLLRGTVQVDVPALADWRGNVALLSIWVLGLHLYNIFGFVASFSLLIPVIPFVGWIIGLILWVIVLCAILINLFRIILSLLRVYAALIITIITGPFWILMGLLPGSPIGFGSWFSAVLQNAITFPIVTIMYVLGAAFILAGSGGGMEGWVPPQIINSAQIGLMLVGIGILFAIPKAPEMVKSFFAKKPFSFETAVGETTETAVRASPGIGGAAWGAIRGKWGEAGQKALQAAGEIGRAVAQDVGIKLPRKP